MRRRAVWALASALAVLLVTAAVVTLLAQEGSFSTRDHVLPVYHRYPRGSATYSG